MSDELLGSLGERIIKISENSIFYKGKTLYTIITPTEVPILYTKAYEGAVEGISLQYDLHIKSKRSDEIIYHKRSTINEIQRRKTNVTEVELSRRINWFRSNHVNLKILEFFKSKQIPINLVVAVGSTSYGACLPTSDFDILLFYDDIEKEIPRPTLLDALNNSEGPWSEEFSSTMGVIPFKIDFRFTTMRKSAEPYQG